jgi:hypothetical protein
VIALFKAESNSRTQQFARALSASGSRPWIRRFRGTSRRTDVVPSQHLLLTKYRGSALGASPEHLERIDPAVLHGVARYLAIWGYIDTFQMRIVVKALRADYVVVTEMFERIRNEHARGLAYEVAISKIAGPPTKDESSDRGVVDRAWKRFILPVKEQRNFWAHGVWAASDHDKLKGALVVIPREAFMGLGAALKEHELWTIAQPGDVAPKQAPALDAAKLRGYREKHVSSHLLMANTGHAVANDVEAFLVGPKPDRAAARDRLVARLAA